MEKTVHPICEFPVIYDMGACCGRTPCTLEFFWLCEAESGCWMPGAAYVDTTERRITFADMTDEDALFVAGELQRIEAEAYARRKGLKS